MPDPRMDEVDSAIGWFEVVIEKLTRMDETCGDTIVPMSNIRGGMRGLRTLCEENLSVLRLVKANPVILDHVEAGSKIGLSQTERIVKDILGHVAGTCHSQTTTGAQCRNWSLLGPGAYCHQHANGAEVEVSRALRVTLTEVMEGRLTLDEVLGDPL